MGAENPSLENSEDRKTEHSGIKPIRLAFFLTMIIFLVEATGGLAANSLALLSDAGHIITDLFALGLAWFAAVQSIRPADSAKTFGYHRVGILAALINAVALILIAGTICYEAAMRFEHQQPIQIPVLLFSALIGMSINLFIATRLHHHQHSHGANLNISSAFLHMVGDIGASLGVIIGGIVMFFSHIYIIDTIISILIAVLIAFGGLRIIREAIDILLESSPRNIDMVRLINDMSKITGIKDVHDLHVWSISSSMRALSCHAVIDDMPPSKSSNILNCMQQMLTNNYNITHATIQFETNDSASELTNSDFCTSSDLFCTLESHHQPHKAHEG